jgi:tetratricopeptide (TPR) repeat protein
MALRPESLWGPYALAQVFEDRREYRRVVETLSSALEQWKPSRGAPAQHGVTLLTHLGFAQLQLGRGDDAAATFERARSLAEGSPSVDVYLAQALVVAKRFDEALRLLTPLRERQPNDYRLAQIAVRALTGLGRGNEALDVLRSAVAAAPGEPPPYLALADLLSEQKREGEAHDVLDDAARRFPKDPSVPFQRGALYERAGEMARAEAAFRDVLTLDPNHAPALNYLGYMLAERGVRLDEALTLIERALSVDPDNGAYLDSLGWTYYQMKQFDRAKVHLARAAEQLPSNSVVQDHLGDVLAALGRREEAIVAWQRALEGDGESVEVSAIQSKIRRARSQAER